MNREKHHHSTENTARIKRVLSQAAGLLPVAHYAALGGLGVAAGFIPEADAAPVHSTATNLAIPATTAGLYINVFSGVSNTVPASVPGWDINPWGSSNLSWFDPTTPTGGTMMRYPGVTTGSAGSLDLGNLVNATGSFGSGAVTFGAATGNWDLNTTNYFGFRFISNDTLLHYGWGTMIVGASVTVRTVGGLWYESAANTGIAVGAVPTPATSLLLAAGAAGLLAFRRRQTH